jgi:hypothetical protein
MWFTILKVFESAMSKESSFWLASGCDRSDQAKLSLGFEKKSARASDLSLAPTKKKTAEPAATAQRLSSTLFCFSHLAGTALLSFNVRQR